jgi:hypothetical protein
VEDEAEDSKSGRSRRVRKVELGKIKDQLFTVLKRETEKLMEESHKAKLSNEQSRKLINYLKLIRELEEEIPEKPPDPDEQDAEDHEDLSDEQLKKMAQKPTTEGSNV